MGRPDFGGIFQLGSYPLLTFLAALFKFPKHKHFRSSVKDLEDLLQRLDDEEDKQAEDQVPQQQVNTGKTAFMRSTGKLNERS